jgi:hypothetical protein
MIPKAVMYSLVAISKDAMQRELLSDIYKSDSFIESLKESEFTVEKRAELRKTIAALKKSEEIVALV